MTVKGRVVQDASNWSAPFTLSLEPNGTARSWSNYRVAGDYTKGAFFFDSAEPSRPLKFLAQWTETPPDGTRTLHTNVVAAPLGGGSPADYVSADQPTQNIVYRGVDGNIYKLYAGHIWQINRLNTRAGAPKAAVAGDPFGYMHPGIEHVAYRGVDGHIQVLFAASDWRFRNVTFEAGAPKAASDPFGYVVNGVQHVAYRGIDGHIHVLFTDPTGDSAM